MPWSSEVQLLKKDSNKICRNEEPIIFIPSVERLNRNNYMETRNEYTMAWENLTEIHRIGRSCWEGDVKMDTDGMGFHACLHLSDRGRFRAITNRRFLTRET
jgi:hypothetical protein